MKKIKILCLLLLFSPFLVAQSNALVNSSIKLSIISLSYNYEYSLSQKVAIIGKAGLYVPALLWNSDDFYYSINPYVGVEGRYNYNILKRKSAGKNTMYNSSNFLALDCKYIAGALNKSDNVNNNSGFLISPVWGLKRMLKNKIYYEFSPGLNFFYSNSNSYVTPRLNFSLGFIF